MNSLTECAETSWRFHVSDQNSFGVPDVLGYSQSIEINLILLKFIKVSSFQKFHFHPAIHRRPEKTDSFVGSESSFVFSAPPQRPMTSDFEGFSIPDFIHYIYFPILILEKGHYWYHFYNVFGMTRSLTGDWTRDLPHSKPALYH